MSKVYKFWMVLLTAIGGLSLLYALLVLITMGFQPSYLYFWGLLFFLCMILDLGVWLTTKDGKAPPKWLVIPVEIIVLCFCLFFILVEVIIARAGTQKPTQNAQYLIILGAKVNGDQPTLTLRKRIDAAADYLKQNPDTIAIASGGKGSDEDISEADCIKRELIASGIEENRIILEDRSTSTKENLVNSGEIIKQRGDTLSSVVLTSTDFHMYRSLFLARNLGYENISGNPAKSAWWLIPTNYTREFMAVVKDVFLRRIFNP